MKKEISPVLIVGAGPTGLTLAIELARRGVPFRLIEERLAPSSHSRAVSISASTLDAFERMGVLPAMLEVGRPVHDIFVHHDGKRRAHVDYRQLAKEGDVAHPFILSLAQPEVETVLERHLVSLGGKVERGTRAFDFTQYPNGVSARLVTAGGEIETHHFSYLAGCDGSRSAVRKQLGIPLEGDGYDVSFIHGEFRIDWDGDKESVHYFMKDGGFWLIVPMPDDWYRIVVGVPRRNPEEIYPVLTPGLFEKMTGIRCLASRCLSHARLYHLVAERVREGRVFLCGDAFHQFSPIGGQGMNTGVQDALNLGWKLAYVLEGRVRPELLDSYALERLPIARQVSAASDASTRLLLGEAHPLREKLLPRMENRARYRKELPFLFSGVAQEYAESLFLRDLRPVPEDSHLLAADRKPRAGRRAPRLASRWEGHTLIARGSAETERLARCYGEWLRVEELEGQDEWFLVRPDGYVECHGGAEDLGRLEDFIDRLYESLPRPYAAFFDVDETLLSFSSMPGFLEYVRASVGGSAFAAWDRRGGLSRAEANRLYYACFEGLRHDTVRELAEAWIEARLARLGRDFFHRETLKELRRHQAAGARIVLVSGSFAPLLSPIARLLGVHEWLAAPIEEREDVLTGRLAGDPTIGEGKAAAMRAYFARHPELEPATCYAYGDHSSDLPMLLTVGNRIAVGDDPTLARVATRTLRAVAAQPPYRFASA